MSEMRWSEAVRLGAMLNPQGHISGTTPAEHKASINGDTTCALVAAQRAVGRDGLSWTAGWPWLRERKPSTCPQCGDTTQYGVWITIMHLNDHHRWTRERIADWVEGIEPAEDTPVGCADQVAMEHALALPSAAQK